MLDIDVQRIVDGIIDDFFRCQASDCDRTDAVFNNATWWRALPVPSGAIEKKNLQLYLWRYTRRLMLHRKLMAVARLRAKCAPDANLPVDAILQQLVRHDVFAWNEFMPEPGTHFGLLMSQIICGPLTQAYLDQAHGGDMSQPLYSFEDSNFRILNTAFMGYKFKEKIWNYYRYAHASMWDPLSPDELIQWGIESLIIEYQFPQYTTTRERGSVRRRLDGREINDSILLDWARRRREDLACDIEFIPPNILAVSPARSSRYSEHIIDILYQTCEKSIEYMTINTAMYHAKRNNNPLILYDFYYCKITNFLNRHRDAWFSTFLGVFVNIICRNNGISPLNRRAIGNERDILTGASFECPYDFFLLKDGKGTEPREIWPVAASIIGIAGTLHGTDYTNFTFNSIEEKNNHKG